MAALERELDASPSPVTRQLYEQLLSAQTPTAPSHGERHAFVGRQAEWSALQTLWQQVNRGNLRVACIAGEAGLGKSRLAEELLHWAEQKLESIQADRLFAATEGNPLFVIKTMRSQLNGAAHFDAPLTLPPKVHGVIRARLAQLSPASRELAGLAAVIGRSFTADLLMAASEQTEETVVAVMDELWQRRIVRVQGTSSYDFSHERLCEVAYGEVPPARRRLLHRRVAGVLEEMHPKPTGALCVQLAHHYEQSGLVEQAVHYLQRAADHAREVYAHRDAIALLEKALVLLQALPDEQTRLGLELEVQMALCGAWHTLKTHLGQEIEVAFTRALELCRLVPQTPHLFRVLWGLHAIALYRSDYRDSITIATQCLRIAEEADDSGLLLQAHHALWAPYFYLSEYEPAFAHMEAGLAIYDQHRHEPLSVHFGEHDASGCALTQFPLGLWNMGYPDRARQHLAEAIIHGRQLTISNNIADLYGYAALAHHLLREPALAQQFAEPALQIYRQKGMINSQFISAITLGWSLAMQGQKTEGLTLARYGLNICREGHHRLHMSQLMCMFAETCMAAGQFHEAIEGLDEAIAGFAHSRDLLCAPDLWRLKGDALLALSAADAEIEECYQTALSLAQELGAKVSKLRAATQLTRLLQRQGNAAIGLTALRTIYDSFSEGFDTPDLLAAKALLGELTTN